MEDQNITAHGLRGRPYPYPYPLSQDQQNKEDKKNDICISQIFIRLPIIVGQGVVNCFNTVFKMLDEAILFTEKNDKFLQEELTNTIKQIKRMGQT